MYKILVVAKTFGSTNKLPYELLRDNGCEVVDLEVRGDDIYSALEESIGDVDGVIAGLETYDRPLIEKATRLKVISRNGVGYDNVDMEAAKEKDIAVALTTGANENSVADLAIALMLSAARYVPYMNSCLKKREAKKIAGVEMWGKTLGVIGTGRIGKGVVRRAKGFSMKILCYDPVPDKDFANEAGVTYVSLETLLKQSDFITLHVPLTDSTKNMLSGKEFEMMKPQAVLVNAARGGIVDEKALFKALDEEKIGAAGLDTMVHEPPYDSPLLGLPNVVITPHIGFFTIDSSHKISMMAAQNLLDILNNRECPNIVND